MVDIKKYSIKNYAIFGVKVNGERCTERLDVVSDIKVRLCGVVDWLFENPDYNPKPRVIPKEKYPVLVDVTF